MLVRAALGLSCLAVSLFVGAGCREVVAPERPATSGEAALQALVDREWTWRLTESPLFASSIGDHRFDDRLPDASPAAHDRRAADTRAFLDELERIDRDALPDDQRIDYDMFGAQLRERLESHRFKEHLLPLNADSGFHTSFALMPQSMPSRRPRTTTGTWPG
jgi:uncharacterized protein (DUF885 family)